MFKAILDVLKQYAGSKKAIAAFAAGAVWVAGKAGLHLDTTELAGAVTPLWIYILAQAHVDHAKEKAKPE